MGDPNKGKQSFSLGGVFKSLTGKGRKSGSSTAPGVSITNAGATSATTAFRGKSLDGAFEVIFRFNIPAGAAAYDLDFQFAPGGCSGLSTYDPSSFPDTIDILDGDEYNGAARLIYGLSFGNCTTVTVTVVVTDRNGEPFTDQIVVSTP